MNPATKDPIGNETKLTGTTADAVADKLSHMLFELEKAGNSVAAERALNLVIAPFDVPDDGSEPAVSLTHLVSHLGEHHPARTVELRLRKAKGLDATITLCGDDQPNVDGGRLCQDRIVLHADAKHLDHAASLLAPLLVRGIPTIAWLPGSKAGPLDTELSDVADRLVFDSSLGDPLESIRRAQALGTDLIHDLAWVDLTAWRRTIAAAFAPYATRRLTTHLHDVEITHAGNVAEALLLAGWILGRTNSKPFVFETDGNGYRIAAKQKRHETLVTVREVSGIAERAGICSVGFHSKSEPSVEVRAADVIGEEYSPSERVLVAITAVPWGLPVAYATLGEVI